MVTRTGFDKSYRDTDIGLLPCEWDVVEIQSVADITTGDKNTQDRKPDGKFPFFVRSQIIERIDSYSNDGEAVLTAGDGVGTGKVFHYINGKFDFHQRVYKISNFDAERLNGYFFYLYFSRNFYNRMMQMTAKSSVDSVRREMIAKMNIPLPTKAEQTSIATALSDADALITGLEKLIAKKKAIKQGAMQELLRPKGGWVKKSLGEVCKIRRGASPRPINDPKWFSESGRGWIRISDVTNSKMFLIQTTQYLSEIGVKHSVEVNPGDLIMSICATIGIPIIIKLPACIHDGFVLFSNYSEVLDKFFLYYFLISKIEFWSSKGQPGTQVNLNTGIVGDLEISFPTCLKEQAQIALILSDMDSEIEALEKKLEKQKKIKQGMMQTLLTGKIRLI